MKTIHDYRVDAAAVSPEVLRQLTSLVGAGPRPTLVGASGDRVELPEALSEVLAFVVDAMNRRQGVILLPEDAALTTQAAADLLGMSRPYLLRLLDSGVIPFHRVGTHRRVRLSDIRSYQVQRDQERGNRLDALTKAVEEAGVYDRVQ